MTAHTAGAVTITVTNGDGQAGTSGSALYTFQPAPTVTSVLAQGKTVAAGAFNGTTPIDITGTGFVVGATVLIGANACTSITVNSGTSLSCTTPVGTGLSGNIATVSVTVTNADTQSGTLANAYSYQVVPTISSIVIANSGGSTTGASVGGNNVVITGSVFVAGATVTLGGSACNSLVVVSSTSITCTTSAHAAGVVSVIIANAEGQSATLTNAYTFQDAPDITSIAPIAGTLSGGTALTITGTGFLSGATVTIGGNACTSVVVASSTSITCTSAAHAAGAVSVIVTNSDTQTDTLASAYTYQAAPTVVSISPNSGALVGGTTLTVTGSGFLTGIGLTLGGAVCAVTTVTSTSSLTCTTATHVAGAVSAVPTNTDGQTSSTSNAFTYASKVVLNWVVGATSPNPPNPDSYGTTTVNTTHIYTLTNAGDQVATVAISKTGANTAAWIFGTDNCTGSLAVGASCTVQVTFLAQFLTTGVTYNAVLNATDSGGVSTTNAMTGTVP
jgi:hypothetical protein